MKKRIIGLVLAVCMSCALAACGNEDSSDKKTEKAKTEETKEAKNEDTTEGTEDFSILDVTTDLVDTAIYCADDANTEYVITLFRDPDGNRYISMMTVAADGSGDIHCGAYDDSCVSHTTDADNVDWTGFDVKDVYTGDDFSVIFTEGDDGSVAVANVDFSVIMEGEYLSKDEAINYMGVAAGFIQ